MPFTNAIYKCHLQMTFTNDIYKCHLQMPFTNAFYKWHLQMTFTNDKLQVCFYKLQVVIWKLSSHLKVTNSYIQISYCLTLALASWDFKLFRILPLLNFGFLPIGILPFDIFTGRQLFFVAWLKKWGFVRLCWHEKMAKQWRR